MSFEEMMKKLKTEYISNLPSKMDELNFLVDEQNFSELENFFHKLKGSGKSYGVSEVTIFGEYFENILKSVKELSQEQMQSSQELLQLIITARQNDQEFDINASEVFQKLKSAA